MAGNPNDPNALGNVRLTTRFIFRLQPDPATEGGMTNKAGDPNQPLPIDQVVALIDVPNPLPSGSSPGTYRVGVVRVLGQNPLAPISTFATAPQIASPVEIKVEPNVFWAAPTPDTGYIPPGNFTDAGFWLARDALPYPKLILTFAGTPQPRAAHIELTYNTTRVQIKDVYEQSHLGRHSVVTWNAPAGRLKIRMVDRGPATSAPVTSIAIAFNALLPWTQPPTPADFALDPSQLRLYDANSMPVASPSVQIGQIL